MQLKINKLFLITILLFGFGVFSYATENRNTVKTKNIPGKFFNNQFGIKNVQIVTLFNNKQLNIFLQNNYKFFKTLGIPIYIYKTNKGIYTVFTYTDSKFFINILQKKLGKLIITNYKPLHFYDIEPVLLENKILKKFNLDVIKENLEQLKNVKNKNKNKFYNCYKNISVLRKIIIVPSKCTGYIFPFLDNKNNIKKINLKNLNTNYFFMRNTPYQIKEVFISSVKKNNNSIFSKNINNDNHSNNLINRSHTVKSNENSFSLASLNTKNSSNFNNNKDINNTDELEKEINKIIEMTNETSKNLVYKINDTNYTIPKNLIGIKILNLIEQSPFFNSELLVKIKKTEKKNFMDKGKEIQIKNVKIKKENFNNDISVSKSKIFANFNTKTKINYNKNKKNIFMQYSNLIIITGIFILLFSFILLIKNLRKLNKKINKLKLEENGGNNGGVYFPVAEKNSEGKLNKKIDKTLKTKNEEMIASEKEAKKETVNNTFDNKKQEITKKNEELNQDFIPDNNDDVNDSNGENTKRNLNEVVLGKFKEKIIETKKGNKDENKKEKDLKLDNEENDKERIKEELKKELLLRKSKRIKKKRKDSK